MKESSGKLDSKANEGHWLGYSSVSKGHYIYGPNRQIMVEHNVTFKNTVLQVPGPILIAGKDKNNPIIKSSNQNLMVQNISSQQKPSRPSGQNASADKTVVDQIVLDLEEASSRQPLRRSERLNPPSEQDPRYSEHLKQQLANFLDTEDLDAELTVAMVSMIDKIIDPPSVEAAKKLDDWPEWEVSIKNELDICRE